MDPHKLEELKQRLRKDRELAYERHLESVRKKQEERKSQKRKSKESSTLEASLTKKKKIEQDKNSRNPSITFNMADINDVRDLAEMGPSTRPDSPNINILRSEKEQFREKISQKSLPKKKIKKKSVSKEVKKTPEYIKMRELANARKKKFLEKMTPEQKEMKRAKDREYYKRKKESGQVKQISDLLKTEQKKKRQDWKAASKRYRKRKEDQKRMLTPPESENEEITVEDMRLRDRKNLGRKKVKKDRAKCYRDLKRKNKELKMWKNRADRYKKRLQRMNQVSIQGVTRIKNSIQAVKVSSNQVPIQPTNESSQPIPDESSQPIPDSPKQQNTPKHPTTPSPFTKVMQFLGEEKVSPKIVKKLLFSEIREKVLVTNRDALQGNAPAKQFFDKCVSGELMKKYRVESQAKKYLPAKQGRKYQNKITVKYDRQRRNAKKIELNEAKIRKFFLKDDNSRMCPGKRDYVRRGKQKMQKRLLLDSIKNLHIKFTLQSGIKISVSTFARYKPFWVIKPTMRDRETCLCEKHSNFDFLLSKLRVCKVINISSTDELINAVCCASSMDCILGKCKTCANKRLNATVATEDDSTTSYLRWETVTEERVVKGEIKNIKMTKKVEHTTTLSGLLKKTERNIPTFLQHVFKMRHHFKAIGDKKDTLKENEMLLQIDFSQNYISKMAKEIQSMHFGASKKQISIQTGVYHCFQNGILSVSSFATVSDNLDHQAYAVWVHLKPILLDIAEKYQYVDTLHILSDGPTGQYRNRYNIFLCLKLISQILPNVKCVSYNWSESGHGKGAVDGVGGCLKRTADQHVLKLKDVVTAQDFVQIFTNSKVKVIHILANDITKAKETLPKNVPEIKGITDLQQVTWKRQDDMCQVNLRKFMCFDCPLGDDCIHYDAGKVDFSSAFNKNCILFNNL